MTRRFAVFAFALFSVCATTAVPPAALAADPAAGPPALSADDNAVVKRAVDYIDRMTSLEGRFTQVDPKGHRSTGLFYMQRPGKARFEYDPPAQLLVVSDGANVSVYDRKLKSFDQYPLAQTPLALLLAKPFRLDRGVAILSVDRSRDGFAIVAGDSHRRVQGRLTLQFSQAPLALKGWTLVDAQGQRTDVKFGALRERPALDPKLFVLRDPKAPRGAPDVAY